MNRLCDAHSHVFQVVSIFLLVLLCFNYKQSKTVATTPKIAELRCACNLSNRPISKTGVFCREDEYWRTSSRIFRGELIEKKKNTWTNTSWLEQTNENLTEEGGKGVGVGDFSLVQDRSSTGPSSSSTEIESLEAKNYHLGQVCANLHYTATSYIKLRIYTESEDSQIRTGESWERKQSINRFGKI